MRHVERRAMIVAADQLNRLHQFFRIWIVEQEREVLYGFVRQPAAAWLFPCQVLIENAYRVSGARKLRTAHCARRSATDDRYVRHLTFLRPCRSPVARSRSWSRVTSRLRCPFTCWPRHETGVSTDRE